MKRYWANKRRSEAQKRLVEKRKAAGIMYHTNGKPYRTAQPAPVKLNMLEQIFGAGTTFRMLTPEQRKQYFHAIYTKRGTIKQPKTKVKNLDSVIENTLKPLQLLITVTVVGDKTGKTLGVSKMVEVAQ
jgi:uncharacterized protein YdeI (YjbR/CyaY-like superfamily)